MGSTNLPAFHFQRSARQVAAMKYVLALSPTAFKRQRVRVGAAWMRSTLRQQPRRWALKRTRTKMRSRAVRLLEYLSWWLQLLNLCRRRSRGVPGKRSRRASRPRCRGMQSKGIKHHAYAAQGRRHWALRAQPLTRPGSHTHTWLNHWSRRCPSMQGGAW